MKFSENRALPFVFKRRGRPAVGRSHCASAIGALLVWLGAASLWAASTETIRIEAGTEKTEYRIGDLIGYAVTVEWKAPVQFLRIAPSAELGVFEIPRAPEIEEKRLGRGWRQQRWHYSLSTFETGDFTIPEFTVVYRDAEGAEQRVPTPPVRIRVQSVAPLRADDEGIRETKGPVEPPRRLPPRSVIVGAAIGALLAVVAGALVIRAIRRRRRELAPAGPPRPIEEIAREQLGRVAESDLLVHGLIKEYFDQVSDVIRRYLGQRYGFAGIVTTTSELIAQLRAAMCEENHVTRVAEFSDGADLAKFARWQPDRQVCDGFLEMAYRVIDETTPRAIEPQQAAAPVGEVSEQK